MQAEELRFNSLENFGQTKARKGEESSIKNQKSHDHQLIWLLSWEKKMPRKMSFVNKNLILKGRKCKTFRLWSQINNNKQTYLCSNNNKWMLLFWIFWVGFCHYRTLQIKSGCDFILWQYVIINPFSYHASSGTIVTGEAMQRPF